MSPVVQSLMMYALAIVISLLVALLIKGIVKTIASIQDKQTAQAQAAAPAPVVPPTDFEPTASQIAAIAAALHSVIGAHRIVHIEASSPAGWAASGRMAHQASHAVTRHSHQDRTQF